MKNGMITDSDGTHRWYLNDKWHRTDGPAIERPNGKREWYLNGKLHRDDGPAIEQRNGTRYWYLNDERHREDGPAVERWDGGREWYLNNKQYTFREWLKHNTALDDNTRLIYMLRYSDEAVA